MSGDNEHVLEYVCVCVHQFIRCVFLFVCVYSCIFIPSLFVVSVVCGGVFMHYLLQTTIASKHIMINVTNNKNFAIYVASKHIIVNVTNNYNKNFVICRPYTASVGRM